jgi:hypothetical protein
MPRPLFVRLAVAAAVLGAAGPALAQSQLCQQYRAELAAIERGGGREASAAAERQRGEIARLTGYYRSIGCDRGPFTFLSGPAPAECGAMRERIRQLEASYGSLAAQAATTGDSRRRQLASAVEQACGAGQPQQQQAAFGGPRSFFESLFGPPRGTPVPPQPVPGATVPEGTLPAPGDEQAGLGLGPLGGGRLACVRTCDGYFFPLVNAPGGRENADDMCQALCPGTETQAFSMPGSDDAIRRAISLKGRPYATMPTAFKFQRSFDESCACKREEESWAVLLRRAESMLDQRRGDVILTAEKAEELSRPKIVQAQATPGQVKPQAKPEVKPEAKPEAKPDAKAIEAEDKAAAEIGAAAPTASQESSGIGPRSIEAGRVIPKTEGVKREVTEPNGTKRAVRIIAPNIIPVPESKRP